MKKSCNLNQNTEEKHGKIPVFRFQISCQSMNCLYVNDAFTQLRILSPGLTKTDFFLVKQFRAGHRIWMDNVCSPSSWITKENQSLDYNWSLVGKSIQRLPGSDYGCC